MMIVNEVFFTPKSAYSVSQNFLTSGKTIARLLVLTNIFPADMVLEIGAGKGHITRALAQRCAQVLTYEIDPLLCARLRITLPQNTRLFQQDSLRGPLPAKPFKVFANIPFNRTTDILRRLTQERHGLGKGLRWLVTPRQATAAMQEAGIPMSASCGMCNGCAFFDGVGSPDVFPQLSRRNLIFLLT